MPKGDEIRFAGESGAMHARRQSLERDNKDSPSSHKPHWGQSTAQPERGTSLGGKSFSGGNSTSYAGVVGTHLTSNENNK